MPFFSRNSLSKPASERKKRFLKAKEHDSYQLMVEDYELIILHYIKKFRFENISVVINGATNFGTDQVNENIAYLQQKVDLLNNSELAYATIVKEYWVPPNASIRAESK